MAMGWLGWWAAALPTVDGLQGRFVCCNRLAKAHIRCCFPRPGAPPFGLAAPADFRGLSLGNLDFSLDFLPRRGRRRGLQGAPPTVPLSLMEWCAACAAARAPASPRDLGPGPTDGRKLWTENVEGVRKPRSFISHFSKCEMVRGSNLGTHRKDL